MAKLTSCSIHISGCITAHPVIQKKVSSPPIEITRNEAGAQDGATGITNKEPHKHGLAPVCYFIYTA